MYSCVIESLTPIYIFLHIHRLRQWGWRGFPRSGASEFSLGQLCCGHGVCYCWCFWQREESSCGKKCFYVFVTNPFQSLRKTYCRCFDLLYLIFFFLKAHGDNPGKTGQVAFAVVDTFVWQALASVIIPGFTINRVCAASLYLLGRSTKWPLPVRKWTTTALGLSTIPFIITPIDRCVQRLYPLSLTQLSLFLLNFWWILSDPMWP